MCLSSECYLNSNRFHTPPCLIFLESIIFLLVGLNRHPQHRFHPSSDAVVFTLSTTTKFYLHRQRPQGQCFLPSSFPQTFRVQKKQRFFWEVSFCKPSMELKIRSRFYFCVNFGFLHNTWDTRILPAENELFLLLQCLASNTRKGNILISLK